jgi:hypothetical protein
MQAATAIRRNFLKPSEPFCHAVHRRGTITFAYEEARDRVISITAHVISITPARPFLKALPLLLISAKRCV